jgi:heme exporter protein D
MSFSNWQEFLAMGGYGFYVWASFGLTALVLGTVMLAPLQRHRALQRDLFRQARRSARENNS